MKALATTIAALSIVAGTATVRAQSAAPAWPPPPAATPPPADTPAPAAEPPPAATPPPAAELPPEPPANPPPVSPAPAPAPASDRLPMRLAVQTEGAIGVYPGDFYNHLVGVRLDLVFSPHVSFGGYVGYVNLKGKDGRAHNALPYAQVEYLVGKPDGVRIPLRFATGYLPRNGPIVRLAAGFAFPVAPNIDLVTELLAPMLWITSDQLVVSMDLAAELQFHF
jgi:hypothetical protein